MQHDALSARFHAAQALTREGGRLARRMRDDRAQFLVEDKGLQDVVSAADRAVEALLVERLSAMFPGDGFLGEEQGASADADTARFLWVIDPIDGTANFVRGLPGWCVSVALVVDGEAELGVVYDPTLDELYAARRGHGATRDGAPIRVSGRSSLRSAAVGLGFSYRRAPSIHVGHVSALLENGCEYRRLGSGALGMAYVADGRLDGYVEEHINSWDVLAGLVLVREAGGWTNDFLAGDGLRQGNLIVACPPALRGPLTAAALAYRPEFALEPA